MHHTKSEVDVSFACGSSRLIKELFTQARSQSEMSVIFIDEIDSLCRRRSSREEEHTRRIKARELQPCKYVPKKKPNWYLKKNNQCI